jgi:hypothetical protein
MLLLKKQLFEKQFNEAISSDPAKKEKYGNIFPQLQKVYAEYKILNKQVDYYSECLIAIDAFYYARTYIALNNELKKKQKGVANTYDKTLEEYKKLGFFKNYNKPTDVKICEAMLAEYIKGVPSNNRPYVLDSFIIANNNDAKKMTRFLISQIPILWTKKRQMPCLMIMKNTPICMKEILYFISPMPL